MSRLLMLLLLVACSKVVKGEGFRATIVRATDAPLVGRFSSEGSASCAAITAEQHEIRLRGADFLLDVVEPVGPQAGPRRIRASVRGEPFTLDRPGTESTLVLDMPRGRAIGSLQATLVHESAGTMIDGKPAPVRELVLEVTFNLQPCL